MNLEQTLLAISNPNDDELTIKGIEAAKANWSEFYPELERLIDQFIADDTSLTDEQEAIVFFGTLLIAELKYTPALEKCLQLFARSDSYLTPIEAIFGDALTELTSTLFYNVADGNTQALSDYIVDDHQAMYCKAAAIEAVFAQYEAGDIEKADLTEYVSRWLNSFLAVPSSNNRFLISALADYCIQYQLDDFKGKFVTLCDNNESDNNQGDNNGSDKNAGDKDLFDEDRFKQSEVIAWTKDNSPKLIESGLVQGNFNVIDTLKAWIENGTADTEFGISGNGNLDTGNIDDFDALTGKGGLFDSILYDENTILENSVPVSSLVTAGRNDPCPCGSGKKYKKCCLR
ncbi:DUF1186 domain-containing protein [Colwellia echini]|uniref:DUF1186 domain-containing protein n=1 Tax=Colwellia echini TaxID=1982103 RepID=A0ABY3N057_9GAMM|nr:DUF1186 domain-containing protein [Colwellia echini]TYK66858.1 DUF1186 domain-containing protein [Colwellia echini]